MPMQSGKMAESLSATQTSQFTAQLVVRDVQASVDFYKNAFNFKEIPSAHEGGMFGQNEARVLECNGLPFLLISEQASESLEGYHAKSPITLNTLSPTIITVLCTNIQKMYEQAINGGARPIQAPHKTDGGATTFLVAGLENYVWRFIDNFSNLSEAL